MQTANLNKLNAITYTRQHNCIIISYHIRLIELSAHSILLILVLFLEFFTYTIDKKLSCRREAARCFVFVCIFNITTAQFFYY